MTKARLIHAGACMGIALQYVNIARDIAVDALLYRVYIPLTWLAEEGLTPEAVNKNPQGVRIEKLRGRLLDRAFMLYQVINNQETLSQSFRTKLEDL